MKAEAVCVIWCDGESYLFSNDEIIRKRGAGGKKTQLVDLVSALMCQFQNLLAVKPNKKWREW